MKIISKIFILIALFLILCITNVNASGILMNLTDYNQNSANIQSESNVEDNRLGDNSINQEENVTESENTTTDDTPRVTSSTTTSDEDEFLTIENVLSIIIIVIGILLVLLAIAILIRFK